MLTLKIILHEQVRFRNSHYFWRVTALLLKCTSAGKTSKNIKHTTVLTKWIRSYSIYVLSCTQAFVLYSLFLQFFKMVAIWKYFNTFFFRKKKHPKFRYEDENVSFVNHMATYLCDLVRHWCRLRAVIFRRVRRHGWEHLNDCIMWHT